MKNKNVLLAALLMMAGVMQGQNLVPNGSFEEYDTECENGVNTYMVVAWDEVSCGLPFGYLHACNNTIGNQPGVPYNGLGYQQAADGDGYISMWTLRMNSQGGFPDGNPQMYATVELTDPLVAGQHYCLWLRVNMADISCYMTGAFHALVGYGFPNVCNYQDTAWDTYATATWDISGVDTANWTLLEAEFEANGGEDNLTIGAFQEADEIDSVFVADNSTLLGSLLAIYIVDNVQLWACNVGVEERNGLGTLELYPNPVSDVLNVVLPSGWRGGLLELFAADGRLVLSEQLSGTSVHLGDVGSGQYLVRLTGEEDLRTGRVTVVR
ncbi:MAG: T9SS type A sorting domain-containing protein [Flavobacteriales bacterium]|nr:MAG: T9SS type A sorting domain-containing protein [Flavobacteriales bacterium]